MPRVTIRRGHQDLEQESHQPIQPKRRRPSQRSSRSPNVDGGGCTAASTDESISPSWEPEEVEPSKPPALNKTTGFVHRALQVAKQEGTAPKVLHEQDELPRSGTAEMDATTRRVISALSRSDYSVVFAEQVDPHGEEAVTAEVIDQNGSRRSHRRGVILVSVITAIFAVVVIRIRQKADGSSSCEPASKTTTPPFDQEKKRMAHRRTRRSVGYIELE